MGGRRESLRKRGAGCVILLKATKTRYGLIGGLAHYLVEDRQQGEQGTPFEDLLGQRIFGSPTRIPMQRTRTALG